MPLNNRQNFGIYVLTIILAMILRIAPWPHFIQIINPDWVLLVLIYWCLALPERVGVFNAWIIGLLTDSLTGRMLGQYALVYALASYVCLKLQKRLRQFPPIQQCLFIFFILLFSHLLVFWTENLHEPTRFHRSFWFPVLSGTGSWPFVYAFLRLICNHRKIS